MALSNLLKIAAHNKKSVAEIDPKKIEDNLDKYQKPKEIVFVPEFKETISGKILRKETLK